MRPMESSPTSFFQNLIDHEEENAVLDVLSYVNASGKTYSDDEIEDLLESRQNTVAIDSRLKQLYDDIADTLPYEKTHELFAVSSVLYNKRGFAELLDETYGKLFDESAPDTGLPFEDILDENQKETFRKLHRILKACKDHPDDQKVENAFTLLIRYHEAHVSQAKDLFLLKSPTGKLQKEFDQYPSLLKYALIKEIMAHLGGIDRFEEFHTVLMGAPFLLDHLEYIKPRYSLRLAMMFTNTSLTKFLTEKEKSCCEDLIKRYGKCKTLGDALQVFETRVISNDLDPTSLIGLISLYAGKNLRMDFEQYASSTRLSRRDIQEMCAFASLPNASDDPMIREFQLIIEMLLFSLNQTLSQQEKKLRKDSSKEDDSLEDDSLVEKFRRSNQDLKTQYREIEKELKSEKELRKKAEVEIQKTKKYYKHTLEKENRELRRENEALSDQVKALEEKIRLLEDSEPLEAVHQNTEIRHSGDAILSHGPEEDLWPDEEKELILSILKKELPKLQEGSRRQLLVQDILDHHTFHGTHEIRKNNLKKTLKGFTTINAATEARLREQGFTLTKTKTHFKISFMNDPRYTYSMPATGSDRRNGDNLSAQINALLF